MNESKNLKINLKKHSEWENVKQTCKIVTKAEVEECERVMRRDRKKNKIIRHYAMMATFYRLQTSWRYRLREHEKE